MRLAVIPARGGSKRIPRKNIKEFAGKPMIAWSIAAAQESGCFDRIIVSTDDSEIADVARSFGADVPFMRPMDLSDDHTGTVPVIAHAVTWQCQQGTAPEMACCIYATAPFLSAYDLVTGYKAMLQSDAHFAVSVTRYVSPIQRALRINEAGRLAMFWPENYTRRSQDLEPAFHDAGQFYWGAAQAWVSEPSVFGPRSIPVVLPPFRVQDIDTPEDWIRAEVMRSAMNSNGFGAENV